MVEPLVLFQTMLGKMARTGLPVNAANPTNPTRNNEMPTQTVPSRNMARQPSSTKETVNKSKIVGLLNQDEMKYN